MAQLVERGFLEGTHTIVEAGTGVGKSLAYLVPAIRSGKKVVLSTGTIALQEQLVAQRHSARARCARRAGPGDAAQRTQSLPLQAKVRTAAFRPAGRLIAVDAAPVGVGRPNVDRRPCGADQFVPPAGEWEQLDADADDCVGEFCEHFRDCFYFKKRDESRYSDLIVVNHALFFLDLAVGGGLLPALRRGGARRSPPMRTLGDRRPYGDAFASDGRPDAPQAAPLLQLAAVVRRAVRRRDSSPRDRLREGAGRSLSAGSKRSGVAGAGRPSQRALQVGKLAVSRTGTRR